MPEYTTLVEALNDLKKRGYTYNFNLLEDCLECREEGITLSPNEFHITEVYRFEGESDPDDNTILYAIESEDGRLKGALVNAYGVYSDPLSAEMVSKLNRENQ
jgi:hypothetical protein